MQDKVKTPEELALNSFLASKTPTEKLQITLEEWESYVKGFFAGYEAARQQPIVITQEHTIAEFKED